MAARDVRSSHDIEGSEKSRSRLSGVVEGRWLRDDAVERLRQAMRDLREAGNAHEQNAGKPTPQRECAGDVCDSEPVGEIVRHAWRL